MTPYGEMIGVTVGCEHLHISRGPWDLVWPSPKELGLSPFAGRWGQDVSLQDTSGSAGYVLRLCGWEECFSICQDQLWLGDQGLGLQKSSSSGERKSQTQEAVTEPLNTT